MLVPDISGYSGAAPSQCLQIMDQLFKNDRIETFSSLMRWPVLAIRLTGLGDEAKLEMGFRQTDLYQGNRRLAMTYKFLPPICKSVKLQSVLPAVAMLAYPRLAAYYRYNFSNAGSFTLDQFYELLCP